MAAPPTVLYVEDETSDVLLMRRAFEKGGLSSAFQTAADGQAAVDYLAGVGHYRDRQHYPFPSVVLLDLNLPEIHGFGVLEWIRRQPTNAGLPVVIFSSSDRDEDRARAKALGANYYWQKPSSPMKFAEVVQYLRDQFLGARPEEGRARVDGSSGRPGLAGHE